MKILAALFLVLFLSVADAGLFAKKLPTLETLTKEYNESINGLSNELGNFLTNNGGVLEEETWNRCSSTKPYKSQQLLYDMGIILDYYRIVAGDEDVANNFRKWKMEFDKSWPSEVKEVEACYNKAFSL